MIFIITNAIISFFAQCVNLFLSLIPRFHWMDPIISAFNSAIAFVCSYVPYALYLFDMPTLKIMFGALTLYEAFLFSEYLWKLLLKYFTRVI